MRLSKKLNDILIDRQDEYGDPEYNFTAIGRIWGALLRIEDIAPHQVALMMDALKSVRLFDNPEHEDSWLDKHGYTQHGQDIANGSL